VRFGTTSATTFTVVSNTQITATVPAGAITAPISVDGPGGTGTSSGNFAVTVAFIATDDAEIDLKLAASNFGAAAIFGVDNKPVKHSLLKFDVDVGANSIASVKLRLYCVDPAPLGGTFFSTGTNWRGHGDGSMRRRAVPATPPWAWRRPTWYEDSPNLVQANGTYSLRSPAPRPTADYATKDAWAHCSPVVAIGPSNTREELPALSRWHRSVWPGEEMDRLIITAARLRPTRLAGGSSAAPGEERADEACDPWSVADL
jgi:hypothetical protein